MEGTTKKRFIFWGIVFILLLSLGLLGRNKYTHGYGKYGEIKKTLEKVSNSFNSLDYIIRTGAIKTEVKNDKLIVLYNSSDKYVYKYTKENNIEYISNEYSNNDVAGLLIARGMCDAIYHLNEGISSIFDLYDYDEFTKTKVEDGINITKDNKTKISINLNTNIINNASNLDIKKKENPVITDIDLQNMLEELTVNKVFKFTKNTKTVYIFVNNNTYEIYLQDTNSSDKKNFNESIYNILEILNHDAAYYIKYNNEDFTKNVTDDRYVIVVNAGFDKERGFFKEDTGLIKIIIYK